MNNAPIGIFDSGLGGLTVARAVIDKLPDEEIIYLGDTEHTPYGPRAIAQVRSLTLSALDELASRGVKALVIACNTATAAALADARERYWIDAGIPVIEVITPAARQSVIATRNHHVGVIGTKATVQSEAYLRALAAVPGLTVSQQACPAFVEFVEAGVTTGEEIESVAREYLTPLKDAGVDTLILGCTHYPLLTGVIGRVMGEGVTLVTSSEATANVTYNELVDRGLLHDPWPAGRGPQHQFLATGASDTFPRLVASWDPRWARCPKSTPVGESREADRYWRDRFHVGPAVSRVFIPGAGARRRSPLGGGAYLFARVRHGARLLWRAVGSRVPVRAGCPGAVSLPCRSHGRHHLAAGVPQVGAGFVRDSAHVPVRAGRDAPPCASDRGRT